MHFHEQALTAKASPTQPTLDTITDKAMARRLLQQALVWALLLVPLQVRPASCPSRVVAQVLIGAWIGCESAGLSVQAVHGPGSQRSDALAATSHPQHLAQRAWACRQHTALLSLAARIPGSHESQLPARATTPSPLQNTPQTSALQDTMATTTTASRVVPTMTPLAQAQAPASQAAPAPEAVATMTPPAALALEAAAMMRAPAQAPPWAAAPTMPAQRATPGLATPTARLAASLAALEVRVLCGRQAVLTQQCVGTAASDGCTQLRLWNWSSRRLSGCTGTHSSMLCTSPAGRAASCTDCAPCFPMHPACLHCWPLLCPSSLFSNGALP